MVRYHDFTIDGVMVGYSEIEETTGALYFAGNASRGQSPALASGGTTKKRPKRSARQANSKY